jgi:hypothetical protein
MLRSYPYSTPAEKDSANIVKKARGGVTIKANKVPVDNGRSTSPYIDCVIDNISAENNKEAPTHDDSGRRISLPDRRNYKFDDDGKVVHTVAIDRSGLINPRNEEKISDDLKAKISASKSLKTPLVNMLHQQVLVYA